MPWYSVEVRGQLYKFYKVHSLFLLSPVLCILASVWQGILGTHSITLPADFPRDEVLPVVYTAAYSPPSHHLSRFSKTPVLTGTFLGYSNPPSASDSLNLLLILLETPPQTVPSSHPLPLDLQLKPNP